MKRALMLLPLLVVITGCPNSTKKQNGPAKLTAFKSATELKQYLVDQYNNASSRASDLGGLLGGMVATGGAVPAANGAADATGTSFSSTNVQSEGVDESDMVKTDGTYIYSTNDMTLNIVQAVPANSMALSGHLDLALPARDLYLLNKQVVVLSQTDGYGCFYPYIGGAMGGWAVPLAATGAPAATDPTPPAASTQPSPWQTTAPTFDVYLVDVTDPTQPALTKKYSFDGGLATSRLIGNKLFLVTQTWLDTNSLTQPLGVQTTNIEDVLPKYRVIVGSQQTVAPMVVWSGVLHPVNPDGYTLTTIVTIDLSKPDSAPVTTGIMADYGVAYASLQSLYITSTNYDYTGAARETTEVHKFDLTGDAAAYVASGQIPGRLLNQYSLDEKDGYLRTATTTGWAGGPVTVGGILGGIFGNTTASSQPETSQNHVVVLKQTDNTLTIAGQLDNIAPGEELYAARFLGTRGFLVTYYQVDPLFTIDLTDPTRPTLIGQLEVPGYSSYIRPLDENHLFTIGKAGDPIAEGSGTFALYKGLTLSIYDITDFANPKLDQQEVIGVRGTNSEALDNPKALVFHNDLVALPVDLYEGKPSTQWDYGYHTFSGLYVYRIKVDQPFELVGRIATVEWSDPYMWCGYDAWTRGVFIGDDVYAVSNLSAQSAAVADMKTVLSTVSYVP